MSELDAPPLWRRALTHLPFIVLLVYFALIFDSILFMTQGAYERDAFFHARYSQLLPERGISREFRWMQFTAWKDAFCDKDFLYHVYLAPFCCAWPEALDGAKFGTLVLALAVLAGVYVVLWRLKAPWPILWVLLLAVGSGLFLNRLLMVRSHVLSIVLMVLALYAILKERVWLCFVVAFIYPWSYSFPLAMLATAVAAELGRRAVARPAVRIPRTIVATALGIGAGLLIHPYSPNTLSTLWLLLNISAAGATGSQVELGSEFAAMTPYRLALALPGLIPAFAIALAGAAVLLKRREPDRRLSPESAAALGAALLWLAAMFVMSRLVEYFAPLAVIGTALVARDWSRGGLPFKAAQPEQRSYVLAFVLLCALLIGACHQLAVPGVRALMVTTQQYYPGATPEQKREAWRRGRYFDGAAEWMKRNLQPQETVINFHWDDFPELFYAAPAQNYIVGLDPTLMRLKYPEHAALLERMRTEAEPLDLGKLGRLFHAEYIVMRRYRAAQYRELREGTIKPVFADDYAVIYRVLSNEY